jgi:hypothetical protein
MPGLVQSYVTLAITTGQTAVSLITLIPDDKKIHQHRTSFLIDMADYPITRVSLFSAYRTRQLVFNISRKYLQLQEQ